MDSVNYIERWLIQRPGPKGTIRVRVDFADGTDHVMAISPGRIGTDVAEQGTDCWHVAAVVVVGGSADDTVRLTGQYTFGPFPRVTAADQFARRLTACLEQPGPSSFNSEHFPDTPVESASQFDAATAAAAPHYDSLTITKVVYAELKADAERYRQLAAGETVDNERLVNDSVYEAILARSDKYELLLQGGVVDGRILIDRANSKKLVAPAGTVMLADSTYRNLTAESAQLHQLLNGKDVDGKRLLPVSYVQRMARLSDALGSALATINDHAWGDDIAHLGFQLERTY